MIHSTKIIGGEIYIDNKLWAKITSPKCELFNICNCKTAMCRTALPDDSCYYYRYFKGIIEAKERKI